MDRKEETNIGIFYILSFLQPKICIPFQLNVLTRTPWQFITSFVSPTQNRNRIFFWINFPFFCFFFGETLRPELPARKRVPKLIQSFAYFDDFSWLPEINILTAKSMNGFNARIQWSGNYSRLFDQSLNEGFPLHFVTNKSPIETLLALPTESIFVLDNFSLRRCGLDRFTRWTMCFVTTNDYKFACSCSSCSPLLNSCQILSSFHLPNCFTIHHSELGPMNYAEKARISDVRLRGQMCLIVHWVLGSASSHIAIL